MTTAVRERVKNDAGRRGCTIDPEYLRVISDRRCV